MKKIFPILLLAMALVYPSYSLALDVAAGAAVTGKTHQVEFTEKRDVEFKPRFTTLDLNLTLIEGKFYARINYDQSIKDYMKSYEGDLGFFSRKDYGITLGYAVIKGLTIFAGHQTGITDMWSANVTSGGDNFEIEYRYEGPYIGLNYNIPVKSHSLGISIASADMDGFLTIEDAAAGALDKRKGETTGLSYGLQLAGPFSEDINYSLYYKINEYDFEDSGGGENWSTEERFDIIGVSLTKFF